MDYLISVIVPVYNSEKYLKKCLNSIISQTYKNLEIILIDDGSTDESGRICDSYKKNDDRIIVFHTKNNGVAAARNQGIRSAKGEYIAFVDSDDYIAENMYELLINRMLKDKSDIAVCSMYRIELNGIKRIQDRLFLDNIVMDRDRFMECFIRKESGYLMNKIYKRKLFQNVVFPVGKYFEDLVTMLQLITNSSKISYVDDPLYYYCKNVGSITTTYLDSPKKIYDRYTEAERATELLKNNYSINISNRFLATQCHSMLSVYEKIYNKKEYSKVSKYLITEIAKLEKNFLKSRCFSNSKKLKCYTALHCRWLYKFIILWERFFKNLKK